MAVTIVSGLPRAGTSMMMQMLAAGGLPVLVDEARPPDDDNPRGYYELARVKGIAADAGWLGEAEGRAVKIVSALLRHLPEGHAYDVLFMHRPLPDVLASQAAMLRRRGETHSVADADMARSFEGHLRRLRAWLDERGDVRVLDVDYDAVVDDPRAAAERVGEFLGADLDVERMASAVEPALRRRRG